MRTIIYFLFGFLVGILVFKSDFTEIFARDIENSELGKNECVQEIIEKGKVESWNLYEEFKNNFYK